MWCRYLGKDVELVRLHFEGSSQGLANDETCESVNLFERARELRVKLVVRDAHNTDETADFAMI